MSEQTEERLNFVALETCPGCGRAFNGQAAGYIEMRRKDSPNGWVFVPVCQRCLKVHQKGSRAAQAALDERLSNAVIAVHRGIVAYERRERAMPMPGKG